MKFSIKVLMAALLFALPFAFISCGDDDEDDNTPKTYSFTYAVESTNPDASELLAVQNAYNTALTKVGIIDGTSTSKTLKVTATSTSETKEQVANRVNIAALEAHSILISTYTKWASSKITVKISGNGLNYKQEYK